jgi:hypothetical protein
MGGLILDNIIVFLYRIIRISIGAYRSSTWPTTTGKVDDSCAPEHEMYPFAEVFYSYIVDGENHSGTYTKGFWYTDSAKHFAADFPPGRSVIIRYRPDHPSEPFMQEESSIALRTI